MAIGALAAARELGIDVPGQLSLVGFDDIAMASLVIPKLTTIAQPKRNLEKPVQNSFSSESGRESGRKRL